MTPAASRSVNVAWRWRARARGLALSVQTARAFAGTELGCMLQRAGARDRLFEAAVVGISLKPAVIFVIDRRVHILHVDDDAEVLSKAHFRIEALKATEDLKATA